MRGGFLAAHYVLDLDEREGPTLRKVLDDIMGDSDFTLNEFEEEIVQGVLSALDPPEKERDELPLT